MRIAHIVSTYPPYYSGMGNVVFQTASELAKLGHEVEVFTPQYYEDKEVRPADTPVAKKHNAELESQIKSVNRLTPSIQYGNAARIPSIKRELDDFDLVHLHYPFFGTANIVRKWKIKNPKKPLVITYHMDPRSDGWKGLLFKLYAKYYMPKILSTADKIIVSSLDYAMVSDASSIYKSNKEKLVDLPFGVDTKRFHPREKPEALFNRHNLDQNTPTIVFVGGMDAAHHFKGIPVLLKALLLLKENKTPIQTVLVGEGNLKEQFELQATAYGIAGQVRFVGRISDEELPFYYNMGDLFVLPSTSQGEAFGMVLLESMASGVPVLASDLPGVRTVALDGGQVVSPNNHIELAESIMGYFQDTNNPEFWKTETRRIVEEKYSWTSIIGKLDKIYTELVST